MSQQGPIIVVSAGEPPPFASALHDAELLPVVPCRWADASRSLAQLAPAAVVVAASATAEIGLEALARQVAATRLYLPLIVVDPTTSLPDNAIPCTQSGGKFDRLIARLRSALRVRTLHSTVMRRVGGGAAALATFDDADPARDPTVVLTSDAVSPAYDLPNLEIIAAEPSRVAANALPLLRQHAFESHLRRMLKSIDAGGLLDPRTGLLAPAAFTRDFATAVHQTVSN